MQDDRAGNGLGEASSAGQLPRSSGSFGPSRGPLFLVSCRSGAAMAERVADRYAALASHGVGPAMVPHLAAVDASFSDTETRVRLPGDVSGVDAFLFQSLFDPTSGRSVDQNLMALLAAARALREWGAAHVTAVAPYLAYARQDKPTKHQREPTTAKLVADLIEAAGVDRVVTWHPHFDQVQGFFGLTPVHVLDAIPLLVDCFDRFRGLRDTLVVAPDAGASKLAIHVAGLLELDCAVASKVRPRPEEAEIAGVIGNFDGKRRALVVDDMVASGGTVDALVRRLRARTSMREVRIAVSHCLSQNACLERLVALERDCGLEEVVVTDSVPQTEAFMALGSLRVRGLADVLGRAVDRVHQSRSVSDVVWSLDGLAGHLPERRQG